MSKPTWPRLFQKWADRLLRETRWRWKTLPDPNMDKDDVATVTYKPEYRTATFHYRPGTEPDNATALHEVVHLLLGRVWAFGEKVLAEDKAAKDWFEAVTEEAVEEIANVILRAYGEDE